MTAEAVIREARRLLQAGDAAAAEAALVKQWPDVSFAPGQALVALAQIRNRQHRSMEAGALLRRAAQIAPNDAQVQLAVGEFSAVTGDQSRAIEAFRKSAAADSSLRAAWIGVARTALALGLAAEAETAARAALAVGASGDAYEILCNALRALERYDEAIAAGDEAMKLAPASASARHARAVALSRAGRHDEALAEFDALAARGVQAPGLWLSRGIAFLSLARTAEAEATFADGIRRWPTDQGLQNALANARWMRGDKEAFTRDYEAAVAAQPDAVQLRIGCADLLRRADARPRAEELLRAGLARRPDDPGILISLGVLLDECDRTSEGLPLLRRAVALAPQATAYRAQMVCALLRLGRGDEALREIDAARRAEPLNQEWICYETMALRQLGDPRYHALCDYERMVRAYDLSAPAGYRDIAAFNEELRARLDRLHVMELHPLDQSLRFGSQTPGSLLTLRDEIVQKYLQALDEPIRAYMASMGPADPNHPWSGRNTGDYRFAGCWSVKLQARGFHINHLHPAGWISSAYYVSLPKAVTAGGDQGWIKFGEPRWPTPGCTVEKVVQPREGRLVLFPSYMWHGTIPFNEGERMTAPFDVVPR